MSITNMLVQIRSKHTVLHWCNLVYLNLVQTYLGKNSTDISYLGAGVLCAQLIPGYLSAQGR